MKTIILIPSRLSATRLPGKPLLKINGLSIISHVFKKAIEANIGDVYVAAEDQEIIDDVKKNGGQAIITSKNNKTGTDRVFEALNKIGKTDIELIMNLQGDEPLIKVKDIKNLYNQMVTSKSMMGTMASNISNKDLYKDENVVKVLTKESLDNSEFPEALNFYREYQNIKKNVYHHIGIYCYQLETLKKFVSLDQSQNEIKNKLEQLRALDNNIKINVSLAKKGPVGVDTEKDFVEIKKIMEYKLK